jgi:hypothetical protein
MGLHERLKPRTYLETGVSKGASLALSAARSIGIDPAFQIRTELTGTVKLARTTSDDFFAATDPKEWLGGPIDLAFIDGMHLFEYALRDFINIERHCRWSSVIAFDDMLPRSVDEAARDRHSRSWTGDVFWMSEVLKAYRPDLTTILVDTLPTGVLVVLGLDPENTTLRDRYDEIVAAYVHDDPQPVPDHILGRADARDARILLDSPVWEVLRSGRRRRRSRRRGVEQIARALEDPKRRRRRLRGPLRQILKSR